MLGNFFICILIDAMGQVLWVMAFIQPTSVCFSAGAPGGLFLFTDQDQKQKLRFPDLLHQNALGVTFSYAKPLCIIQKSGPAQMSKWETSICCYETEQKDLIYSGVCRGDAHAASRYLWSAECSQL